MGSLVKLWVNFSFHNLHFDLQLFYELHVISQFTLLLQLFHGLPLVSKFTLEITVILQALVSQFALQVTFDFTSYVALYKLHCKSQLPVTVILRVTYNFTF